MTAPAVQADAGNGTTLGGHPDARPRASDYLKYTETLDSFRHADLTPVIGREFTDLSIRRDLLGNDDRIRDLAVTVSRRGVVFLRGQNDATVNDMRELTLALTRLAGSPSSSGLHVHPLTAEGTELGDDIGVISAAKQRQGGGLTHQRSDVSRFASMGWHSDITFEKVPSDYAMLKVHTLPPTGGDTLWTSGYELYDRLSTPMRAFLSTLTATHDANFFHDQARRLGHPLRDTPRGHALNSGPDLSAVHPVIRTNPVTGWRSVFVNRGFTKRINGVTKDESDALLKYLFGLVTNNHDAQVRFRWGEGGGDVAVWDNRSTLHCATYDYGEEDREGDRVCSLGEAPFLDLARGGGRREALEEEGKRW